MKISEKNNKSNNKAMQNNILYGCVCMAAIFFCIILGRKVFSKNEFAPVEKIELEEKEMSNISEIRNPVYELFYGEWEITETIYVDPVPTYGTTYTEQQIEDAKSYYYDHTEIRKIQFTPDIVLVNGNESYDEITYTYVVFPADIDYNIHFAMTSKDIGLTEEYADYYLFVRATSGKSDTVIEFFLKDHATIIVCYDGFYCVEYTKVSDNGNNPEITIFLGKN